MYEQISDIVFTHLKNKTLFTINLSVPSVFDSLHNNLNIFKRHLTVYIKNHFCTTNVYNNASLFQRGFIVTGLKDTSVSNLKMYSQCPLRTSFERTRVVAL